ncbi:hypothetical protein MKC73_08290 [[Clostridium] innocuum]|nr:hypothetical protein [[Clostridium] innocuum]
MQKQRNRYYHGKMLRSEDFICEQRYLLEQIKERTHLMLGEGILYGLHVTQQAKEALQISAGGAIDANGNYIHLDHDLTIMLEELSGFSQLNANAGWITLQYKETAVEKEFCEFPSADQHEEYGKWEDGYELCIQRLRLPDYLEEELFQEQVVFEDSDRKLYLILPRILPHAGDVQLQLIMEQRQEAGIEVSMTLRSPLYHIQSIQLSAKQKQTKYTMEILLKRNEQAGGHYAMFHIDQLKLENRLVSPSCASFEIEIAEHIEQAVMTRFLKKPFVFQKELVLGYVDFCFQKDHLEIQRVEEIGRLECQRPQLDMVINEFQRKLHWRPPEQLGKSSAESPQTKEACGILSFQCDSLHPVFYSDEISHGLGPGEVQLQLSLELQKNADAQEYRKQLISGDSSLFQKEEIRWAVRSYPWTGSFQAAVAVPEDYYEQKLILHWYAKAWDMKQHEETENHLLRLEPSTLTCRPQETCRFTAVFDKEDDSKEVRYSLDERSSGELQEDGTFIAGHTCGLYQIRAYYREQQVSAYVKVMDKHE